jgi:hypothetical protein
VLTDILGTTDEKSGRPTFNELFFDRSSSYSFLIRFTSSLSEAFSCFKTSAR